MKKIRLFLLGLILPILYITSSSTQVLATPNNYSANIISQGGSTKVIMPDGPLFDIKNLNPGDQITRNISFYNQTSEDFILYLIDTSQTFDKSGLDALLITIYDEFGNIIVQNTSFYELYNLALGTIFSGKSTTLTFNLILPASIGNQY